MSTAEKFRRVARRLRDVWGITVHEVDGWATRGQGTMNARGFVRHHTAGSRAGGRYASLRVVTYGRSDLRNALCHWYIPRGAGHEVWLIAARVAWHAGSGGWQGLVGNSSVVGLEMENDGRGEPWHPDAMYAARALEWELAREFGWPYRMACEHYEWTTRKIDRANINGQVEREIIARLVPPGASEEEVMSPEQELRLNQRLDAMRDDIKQAIIHEIVRDDSIQRLGGFIRADRRDTRRLAMAIDRIVSSLNSLHRRITSDQEQPLEVDGLQAGNVANPTQIEK